jgi:hypothetical protein
MTLIVLTVELRDWTRSVTLHCDRADAFARLRVGFPDHAALADDALLEAICQDGNIVHLDEVEAPEVAV